MGRTATAVGRGSSNPQPHQKMMLFDLSKLFVQLLLPRQQTFKSRCKSAAFFIVE